MESGNSTNILRPVGFEPKSVTSSRRPKDKPAKANKVTSAVIEVFIVSNGGNFSQDSKIVVVVVGSY
ncbi:hypothetical protein HBI73_146360 [Parastagonospora nodorum]|nr:hypothetical protein HBH52_088280 [Parastagonospora nodorum]KAH4003127.1 hypothetical protein HBI10_064580 [Parastagonospora nodorum]KAH4022828.1 hypothetical protein HBI09_168320 [Parastagonospora nodorum]KAH4028304.1 hypothetical protein HBI13_053450 [Parastagonospora nodorum]KAH4226835.1 hypothetical protein HBI06_103380 [Parastagonospora nodorum]